MPVARASYSRQKLKIVYILENTSEVLSPIQMTSQGLHMTQESRGHLMGKILLCGTNNVNPPFLSSWVI